MCKLAQALMEQTYNRKAIREKVSENIKGTELGKEMRKAIKLVNAYREGEYYKSKELRIEEIGAMESEDLIHEVLVAVMLSTEPQPIQAVAARIANHFPYANPLDGIKTASEIITLCCDADLFDIILAGDSETGSLMVQSQYVLEDDILAAIELTKYLPPMVCEPVEIDNNLNMDTSHLTFSDSLILGGHNHHYKPIATDVVNQANKVELSLDKNMLNFSEVPNKALDTPEKIQQFATMASSSKVVYKEMMDLGNSFYLTWKYDFRGRIYSQGYHVNIQSTGYKKALINLARKEVITL